MESGNIYKAFHLTQGRIVCGELLYIDGKPHLQVYDEDVSGAASLIGCCVPVAAATLCMRTPYKDAEGKDIYVDDVLLHVCYPSPVMVKWNNGELWIADLLVGNFLAPLRSAMESTSIVKSIANPTLLWNIRYLP